MEVDKRLIEHVAKIARIKLNKGEVREFIPQFKEILKVFSEIDQIKTEDTLTSPLSIRNKSRSDKEDRCLSEEEIFANTENKEKGFFKGPKIK